MTGTEQLRAQLDALRDSLRAFDDPIVEEIAGLRLMHETLRERERHIAKTIRKNETASVTVKVKGAAADGAAPATTITAILTALRDATSTAALATVATWDVVPADTDVLAAVEPQLADLEIDDATVTLVLTRPPTPLAAQLADPETATPLAETALQAVLEVIRLAAGPDATGDPVGTALRPLAELLLAQPLTVELSLEAYVVRPMEVTLDRVGAQRLLGTHPSA